MFIRKRLINGQTYYVVEEAIRRKDKPHPVLQTVVYLGHEKNLARAYQKELRAYLKAADKLARMEKALAAMGSEAEYCGGRAG
jgi:hypothetical protein